jgi:hypothetical protein
VGNVSDASFGPRLAWTRRIRGCGRTKAVDGSWDELPFHDLDTKRGIAAGDRWERALHECAELPASLTKIWQVVSLASGNDRDPYRAVLPYLEPP